MIARWMLVLSVALVPWLGASGCHSPQPEKAELVTRVEMARPASERPARAADTSLAPRDVDGVDEAAAYCRQVERQARETNATLPKRLDKDTSATRVAAYGCDVVLEYAMLDLKVSDVAVDGMREMRADVLQKLCSDSGARGVMEHGGSFTNVYRDDRSALIDQFTITTEDCPDRRSADGIAAKVDL